MCVSTSTQTGDEVQYVEVIYVRRPRGRPRGSNKTPEDKAQAARDNAKQYYEKHRDDISNIRKNYYAQNRDVILEYKRQQHIAKQKSS